MNINGEIARIFNNIANMLDIAGENPFKVRAYKRASRNILNLDKDIGDRSGGDDIENIDGIGKDLAKKIREFIDEGRMQYYEDLKAKIPETLTDMLNVQGIGPKLLKTLYQDFNVREFSDLERVIESPELLQVKGIGIKKIKEIRVGIKLFKSHIDKINLGFALPVAESLRNELAGIRNVDDVKIVGSLRRGSETTQSIDIIVVSDKTEQVREAVINSTFVREVLKSDDHGLSLLLNNNMPVNVYLSTRGPSVYSTFLRTGSEGHVERIEDMARQNGTDLTSANFSSEADLYAELDMQYIPPELREDKEEIKLSISGKLGTLIDIKDIRGDLHTHSTWSDGRSTVKEMAIRARDLGYEYIAVTDHSPSSRIANGLDVDRLNKKIEEIREADVAVDGIKVIMGAEVDIKPDGRLDYPDEVLKELDVVIASVHSNFKMEKDEMTRRITSALRNPYVAALGHPTGRLIGFRNPYDIDMDEIMDTARKYGKALEVNSSNMRLDLKDEHVKNAVDKGVKLIISTDAHHVDQLAQMIYGILTARRGRVRKDDVVNTGHLRELQSWLNNFR